MNVAAGPKLAAAVTNAGKSTEDPFHRLFISVTIGGIGVIGGVRQSPRFLQGSIDELKSHLEDKNAPFGVDLLIPQVGGSARKTNVCPVTLIQDVVINIHPRKTTPVVNCQN